MKNILAVSTALLVTFSGSLIPVRCQKNAPVIFPEGLPSLNIDEKKITLSGFSSGGSFSQMMLIAHSSRIYGIAVFSHTFYRCGPSTGKIDDYDAVCTKLVNTTALYDVNKVHAEIQKYHAEKIIDDPKNLASKKLYLYTALRNFLFTPDQSLSVIRLFERYIPDPKRIFNRVQDSALVLPTDNSYGRRCTENAEDRTFIGNCGFSGPQEAINFLLRNDLPSIRDDKVKTDPKLASRLKAFDQTPFTKDLSRHHMDTIGYYFVPSACGKNNKCKLHFYFHGCLNGREYNGTIHVLNSGYLEIGEQYGIIMVFPQARGSLPENEIGCWDTFGLSGPQYATKRGAQIVAVTRMMDKLLNRNSGSSNTENNRPASGWGSSYHGNRGNNHYRKGREGNGRSNEWWF